MTIMCRQSSIASLTLLLIATGLATPVPSQADLLPSAAIAQAASAFDTYMKQGYAATAKRNYREALKQFRRAEELRPGNRYATLAIQNVSNYVSRGQSQVPIFIPPNTGAPIARVGGATRSASDCSEEQLCLIALLPARSQGTLLTSTDYPTLLFYVSTDSAESMELRVLSADQTSYSLQMDAPKASGIVSVSFSALQDATGKRLPPLQTGQLHRWIFTVMTNNLDRSQNPSVDGTIQRADLDPILVETIEKTPECDRVSLYTANNIWYDALATIYLARRSQGTNSQFDKDWTALLETVGLEKFASAPLLPCCTGRQ